MGENPQAAGEPYSWDENTQPPPETRKLWQEVATGIDTTQTGASTASSSHSFDLRRMTTKRYEQQFSVSIRSRCCFGGFVQKDATLGTRRCVVETKKNYLLFHSIKADFFLFLLPQSFGKMQSNRWTLQIGIWFPRRLPVVLWKDICAK